MLNQDWEFAICAEVLEVYASVIQFMFLGGLFALMFLFDQTIPSSVSTNVKYVISIRGFVCFTAFSLFFSNILKAQKMKLKVANLILSSINRIRPNQFTSSLRNKDDLLQILVVSQMLSNCAIILGMRDRKIFAEFTKMQKKYARIADMRLLKCSATQILKIKSQCPIFHK